VPALVEVALALPVRQVVLDGEAIALREDGRPQPLQVPASRAASRSGSVPAPFFLDVLHVDGQDVLGRPLAERAAVLDQVGGQHAGGRGAGPVNLARECDAAST